MSNQEQQTKPDGGASVSTDGLERVSDEALTAIYNEVNGLDPKRHNPITTERIFAAMRAAMGKALDDAADWFNAPEQDAWEIAGELRDMADKMRSNVVSDRLAEDKGE